MMAEVRDLLVEVGTEELPPKALRRLSQAFGEQLELGLGRAGLSHGEVSLYATPRRLAALVSELNTSQPERQTERRGPALAAAFDADGKPTKAAGGFARSCGVEVEHLEKLESDQGSWLVFRTTEVGQSTTSLLPAIVNNALAALPIPKRMRWGNSEVEFVRPVHWVVLLFGEDVIEADILGVSAGRMTFGHRFHHPEPLPLERPEEYPTLLYGQGHVVADFASRQDVIRRQIDQAASDLGGQVLIDEDLLAEVAALVEWPSAIAGDFDEQFLELPAPVLIATMQGHQRYFPVVDSEGKLLAHFVTVSNIDSTHPDSVRQGNERVIRPRLSDAAFFYKSDLRSPLASRLEELKEMVFQEKLGSLFDKSQRVAKLAAHVAIAMGRPTEEVDMARRAGLLCKCDLVTDLVGEFPELQGYMGREYALRSGEREPVAVAIEQAYLPRFAKDAVPSTPVGQALAIADRLDTLLGIFGVGQAPSGDKDPFALRRAALGTLRIIIEGALDINLSKLIGAAAEEHKGLFDDWEKLVVQTFEFMMDRLRAYFLEQGIPTDVFAAVLARLPERPYDFARRVHAVDEFRKLPEASSLAAANKRIQNILRQSEETVAGGVNDGLLREDAEWNLAAKLVGLAPQVRKMLKEGDYTAALTHLAGLRDSVDAFFDSVRVMDDDAAVRNNRLALLHQIHSLFLETADISYLQG